ncbi:MAG: hypothetical protein L6Q37_14950, partial [Bdellovibrionaceae bacterium]|nr:hypothetical protein [Pseudobdellovibrionaceae bacterium]
FLLKVAPDSQFQIDLDFLKKFIFTYFREEINLRTFSLSLPSTFIHYSEIGDCYNLFFEKYLKKIMAEDETLKELPIFPLTDELLLKEDVSKLRGLKFLKNKIFFNDITQALVRNPDLKIYFFIGKEDVYTPPAAYDEMREYFSSESRIKFIARDGDHFNFFKELLNLNAFLKQSDKKKNSLSCKKYYF